MAKHLTDSRQAMADRWQLVTHHDADFANAMLSLQEETLRQKAGVMAVIEELGKLEPLLAEAAVDEVATAKEKEKERERVRAERRAQKEAEAAEKQVGHVLNLSRSRA